MRRSITLLTITIPFAWALAQAPANPAAPPATTQKAKAQAPAATAVVQQPEQSKVETPAAAAAVAPATDTAKSAPMPAASQTAQPLADTAKPIPAAPATAVQAVPDTQKASATKVQKAVTAQAKADTAKKADSTAAKVAETRIFLAVVDLVPVKVPNDFALGLSDSVRKAFTDLGLYSVIGREQMLGNLATLKRKIPEGCSDTRCMLKIGKLLGLSKIVGGELSQDGKLYALKMTMTDVISGQTESRVWIASECSEADAVQLIKAAILKLHQQVPPKLSIAIKDYRGPEFSKHPLWAVTAGATIAAGLAYGLIDGGLTGSDDNSNTVLYTRTDDPASGIPAAFANLGYGARPHAMGYAFTALSDDADGLFWNPAGLARIQRSEISASYLKTMVDVGYLNAQYISRFSRTGAFGAGLLHNGDPVYGEIEFISSCAKLFDEIHPALRPFAVGANVKIRTASTGEVSGEEAVTGNSFGFSFDAGMQFELADHIELGLLARDLFSKPQKWNNTLANESYYEGTPTTLIIGGAFYADPTLLLVMDGHIPVYQDQIYQVGMGLEKVVFNVLALRAGLFQNLEFREDRRITTGAGLELRNAGCDISYEFAEEEIMGGALRVSTSWKF